MKWDVAPLKQRPNRHGELLPASVALIDARAVSLALKDFDLFVFATVRANGTIGPAQGL